MLVAFRRGLNARVIESDLWANVEQIRMAIQLADRTIYLCAVYFPPNRVRDADLINTHSQ